MMAVEARARSDMPGVGSEASGRAETDPGQGGAERRGASVMFASCKGPARCEPRKGSRPRLSAGVKCLLAGKVCETVLDFAGAPK